MRQKPPWTTLSCPHFLCLSREMGTFQEGSSLTPKIWRTIPNPSWVLEAWRGRRDHPKITRSNCILAPRSLDGVGLVMMMMITSAYFDPLSPEVTGILSDLPTSHKISPLRHTLSPPGSLPQYSKCLCNCFSSSCFWKRNSKSMNNCLEYELGKYFYTIWIPYTL